MESGQWWVMRLSLQRGPGRGLPGQRSKRKSQNCLLPLTWRCTPYEKETLRIRDICDADLEEPAGSGIRNLSQDLHCGGTGLFEEEIIVGFST